MSISSFLKKAAMYRNKIVGKPETFSNYSVYSNFSTYTLRYQNSKPCLIQCQIQKAPKGVLRQISTVTSCCLLFIDFCLNLLVANILPLSSTYWKLCYFLTEQRMMGDMAPNKKEHKHQVVQILKHSNDMEDSQSSDDSDSFERMEAATRTKTKRSLFATLIKRKQTGKSKVKITKQIETCSAVNFGTDTLTSEQELAHFRYSAEMTKSPRLKNSPSKTSKNYNIFKKIMKKSRNAPSNKKDKCGDDDNSEKRVLKALTCNKLVPTAYLPKYNIKLINGINELNEILHNVHHNEQHMVYLLRKYIDDTSMEKQLLDASYEYFALQYDSKRQVNILADKLWFEQTEAAKTHEYNIQKRLNHLVKTNRTLEAQMGVLCRHCEKLRARSNLYPKRFLHMRSFGKVYAKQLIDSNRKLQKKLSALTGVISDFEDELQKMQHRKEVLEDEKRTVKTRIYHLEGVVEKKSQDYELEKSSTQLQLKQHDATAKEAVVAVNTIIQDVYEFEFQFRELTIQTTGRNLQFQNLRLPEMIYQVRSCVGEMFLSIIAAYREMALIVQDVTKLRNTNARLQENLQKSTNELNNMSKKLEKSSEVDVKALEAKCKKLEDDNLNLRAKLANATEHNSFLKEEVEVKRRSLTETKTSMNDLSTQSQIVSAQLDEVIQTASQFEPDDVPKEFNTNRDKLDFLKSHLGQIITNQKDLTERCHALDEDNQTLLQHHQAYQQDLATLQDAITFINSDNENLKKQFANEQQTVATLQTERVKYLEEKNILKTVFQHLKSEVARIQQLEGAVADMSKETNRLSLIAEFNKQLGEQLRSEVEMKESTITELKGNLKQLSHMQVDTDKQRLTLSAQLSEVSTVKEKLTNCLEVELNKNLKLDESKKQLESTTKSQLKVYEEMQKNERSALKELLRDFKHMIKQRDCLVLMQEENKKKNKELEKHCIELKREYEDVASELLKKDEGFKLVVERLDEREDQIRRQEETFNNDIVRYEKTIRKLEKLIGQIRNEKNEVETGKVHLKNNLDRTQNDLEQARQQAAIAEDKLAVKAAEFTALESQLNAYKNDLHVLNQEHAKVSVELEFLKKMNQQHATELKDTLCVYSHKDAAYMETQSAVINKEHQISDLTRAIMEKEGDIRRLEQECKYLKKENEDQVKIMVGYENHIILLQDTEATKLKIEKELNNLQSEHKTISSELENARKENEIFRHELKVLTLKNDKERTFYKHQTSDIILEYSEQKASIEEEIDSISSQLRSVTGTLNAEKLRFDELAKSHEVLQGQYKKMQENYDSEVTARTELTNKFKNTDDLVAVLKAEKDNLQQQVSLLLIEINEGKDVNVHYSKENKKMQMILEQGKQKYRGLLIRNDTLTDELQRLKREMESILSSKTWSQGEIDRAQTKLEDKTYELKEAKENIESLKTELRGSQKRLSELKEEFFKLQQQVTGLEFKNCELTLQLHETHGKLETEIKMYKDLKTKISESEDDLTPMPPSDGEEMFH